MILGQWTLKPDSVRMVTHGLVADACDTHTYTYTHTHKDTYVDMHICTHNAALACPLSLRMEIEFLLMAVLFHPTSVKVRERSKPTSFSGLSPGSTFTGSGLDNSRHVSCNLDDRLACSSQASHHLFYISSLSLVYAVGTFWVRKPGPRR